MDRSEKKKQRNGKKVKAEAFLQKRHIQHIIYEVSEIRPKLTVFPPQVAGISLSAH